MLETTSKNLCSSSIEFPHIVSHFMDTKKTVLYLNVSHSHKV